VQLVEVGGGHVGEVTSVQSADRASGRVGGWATAQRVVSRSRCSVERDAVRLR